MKTLNVCFAALCFFFISPSSSYSQSFAGYRTGNYRGVTGLFFNPANIADSRYRWDASLFSLNTIVGNNKASFSISDISGGLDGEELKDDILRGDGLVNAQVQFDLFGPAAMFSIGPKNSFAISTRVRAWVNIADIDGGFVESISQGDEISYPYNFSNNGNSVVSASGWSEFGASWARILYQKDKHFIKAGLTAKYLAPAVNGSLSLNQLRGTINEDAQERSYLANTTGSVQLNFGGLSLNDVAPSDLLTFGNGGFGADLGVVYEYRPEEITDKSVSKYKWRVSASVLDIGRLKYRKDNESSAFYQADITGNERFYLDNLDEVALEDYKEVLDQYPQFFTSRNSEVPNNYKVSLPTTLQFDVDYHIHRGFYVNAAMQLPLVSEVAFDRMRPYSQFALTPRYEGRSFGAYLPVQTNSLTGFSAGLALRAGPVFLGSGSILSALGGQSKQVDFFLGIRFGGLHKKVPKLKDNKTTDSPTNGG